MKIFSALWETLFPYIPRCTVCGTEENVLYLCPACKTEMNTLRAGQANTTDLYAFSAYRYDGAAAHIVQSYKYGGCRWLSAFMAQELMRTVADAHIKFDCVCHVPLHPKRRRRRGFDQAALLAKRFAELAGKPTIDAIARVRNTPSQTTLSATQRKENMRDAFDATHTVQGRVLLIDDVFTTGATASACANVLKAAGAQSVAVVTFAQAREKEHIIDK